MDVLKNNMIMIANAIERATLDVMSKLIEDEDLKLVPTSKKEMTDQVDLMIIDKIRERVGK